MLSDIDICRSTQLTHIDAVAEKAGLLADEYESHGHYKAKVSLKCLAQSKHYYSHTALLL